MGGKRKRGVVLGTVVECNKREVVMSPPPDSLGLGGHPPPWQRRRPSS